MDHTPLSGQDQELLRQAIETTDRLYRRGLQEVGAAVRTAGGEIYAGIHFEASGGFATVCGEIAAISCMVAAGHRDLDTTVAIWRDGQGRHYILPPCGRCREVISDFQPRAWVIVTTLANHWDAAALDHPGKIRIGELLPLKPNSLVAPGSPDVA